MRNLKISFLIIACAAFAPAMAQAQSAQGGNNAPFDRLCSERGDSSQHSRFVEWLEGRLKLNDVQKASFKDFQDARAKSLSDSKAKLCATKPDLSSFEARLVFGQTFLEARLEAVKAENPKLIAFYNSLDEQQKKKFDEIREHARR
jgi:hypothetical protein